MCKEIHSKIYRFFAAGQNVHNSGVGIFGFGKNFQKKFFFTIWLSVYKRRIMNVYDHKNYFKFW